MSVSAFWSMDLIAAEIENPFGDDANDLPVAEFQVRFNRSLATLLEEDAQTPPPFSPPESGASARRSQWHQQIRQSCVESPTCKVGFTLSAGSPPPSRQETPVPAAVADAAADAATRIMPPTPKGGCVGAEDLQIVVPDQPEAKSEPPCRTASFGAVKDAAPTPIPGRSPTEEVASDDFRIVQPQAPKSVCFGAGPAGFALGSGGSSAELLAELSADVKRIASDVGYVHWRNDINRLIDLMEQVAAPAKTPTFH